MNGHELETLAAPRFSLLDTAQFATIHQASSAVHFGPGSDCLRYLEAGLTTSPEMIVFTAEIIAMLRPFAAGVSISAETLALDVIHQVGPGGDYLAEEHTRAHFREFWQPALFTRQPLDDWLRRGGKDTGARLRERTVALMEAYRPEPLPGGVEAEIDYILQSEALQSKAERA